MTAKVNEDSYAFGAAHGRLQHRKLPAPYVTGDVLTVHGIVSIYSDSFRTRYDFAWQGRHWMRTEHRIARTDRGIAIEASKLANRIASGADL